MYKKLYRNFFVLYLLIWGCVTWAFLALLLLDYAQNQRILAYVKKDQNSLLPT